MAGEKAAVSSTFNINFEQDAGTGTALIGALGIPFKVSRVSYSGLNTSALTVKKNAGGATVASVTLSANGDLVNAPVTGANADFGASDDIEIVIGTANGTRVVLECVATSNGQPLTVTV